MYARQLDFFKIELGVLQPDNKIIYVFNLTKPKPDTRTVSNPSLNEKRYYLTWRTGEMQQADRDLLAKAGVDSGDRLILKFLPPEVERTWSRRRGATAESIRRRWARPVSASGPSETGTSSSSWTRPRKMPCGS